MTSFLLRLLQLSGEELFLVQIFLVQSGERRLQMLKGFEVDAGFFQVVLELEEKRVSGIFHIHQPRYS